jgi:hypothetical protein
MEEIYDPRLINIEPWEWESEPFRIKASHNEIKIYKENNLIHTYKYTGQISLNKIKKIIKDKFIIKGQEREIFLPHLERPYDFFENFVHRSDRLY